MSTAQPELSIAMLTTLAHFDRCVEIQLATWGYSDGDVIPRRMFTVAHRIGGQVLGAFDGENMVGFAMALPGIRDGAAYLHSHMLAVLPEYRNQGLGRRLKLAQRDGALALGIELIEWTFDPLEIRNAHLNIARLGVIVRRYEPDFYGPSTSPLQGGLPTDRMIAEWRLRSPHVEGVLHSGAEIEEIIGRVDVPAEIALWKQRPEHRELALNLQTRIRELLKDAFSRGIAVIGYELDAMRNGAFLLGPFPKNYDRGQNV